MTLLDKIKKIDWQYLVSRRGESLLFRSITDNSSEYFKKLTDISWRSIAILRLGEGELFHSKKKLDELRTIFSKGGIKLLSDFRCQLIFYIKSLNSFVKKIEKTDCPKLKETELLQMFKKYFQTALYAHSFLLPMPVSDGVISNLIINKLPSATNQEKQKWLIVLTASEKENEHTKEEKSFYKLAVAYKKNKNFGGLLKKHLKQFAWIGARGYLTSNAWKEKDIKERLNNFFIQKKKPEKELEYLNIIKKEKKLATRKLFKKLAIKKSSELYKLILLAKEFAYLRTWRTDIIYSARYNACNLFSEIAKRSNINEEDMNYLTFYEIIKTAEKRKLTISKSELKKRKEYFATVLLKNRFRVLSGKEWQKKLQYIVLKSQETAEIKGNIAFQGKCRGIAKVLFAIDDIKKVEPGDVLVAVMTFPHFIAAMEKAAAFITDEGGILCHAAIISREMRKPCIIGTKIATKVLKDGDLVEVDANKGIVRIVK